MRYDSRRYALLNSPVEVRRHVRRVRRHLDPRPTDRILDVGCGRGFVLREVQRLAPATSGVDVNPEAVAHAVTGGTRVMDAQRLAFADGSFDKVYSFHALEHIPDLAATFAEIDRVLRPAGRALLVYPAEPIRGLYVVPTAMRLFGNPLRARDIHIHRLSPRRLMPYLAGTSLTVEFARLEFLLTPQFVTVLRKARP